MKEEMPKSDQLGCLFVLMFWFCFWCFHSMVFKWEQALVMCCFFSQIARRWMWQVYPSRRGPQVAISHGLQPPVQGNAQILWLRLIWLVIQTVFWMSTFIHDLKSQFANAFCWLWLELLNLWCPYHFSGGKCFVQPFCSTCLWRHSAVLQLHDSSIHISSRKACLYYAKLPISGWHVYQWSLDANKFGTKRFLYKTHWFSSWNLGWRV